MKKYILIGLLVNLSIPAGFAADDLEDALSGFDEPVLKKESSELDDALEGFDDKESTAQFTTLENTASTESMSISGNIGFESSYNTAHDAPAGENVDYRGFSKLLISADVLIDFTLSKNWKAKVELQSAYDLIYSINDSENYNADTLSTYESDIDFSEVYIIGSMTESVDIKFGRQIEVWGKSDSIRVTDVINPLDNREPGLIDIEDLRLPVLISKLSLYSGDWSYNLLAIHEQRNPVEAAIDSEFFPTSALPFPPDFVMPDVGDGEIDLSETTLAISIDGRFSGWDLSLYAGRVTDSRWHFENNQTQRLYGLIDMTGIATNFIVNGFLIKAEIAYLSNLVYNTTSDKKSRVDSLLGIEYQGITDWVLSAEYANRSIQDYEDQMINSPDNVEENTAQLAIRTSYSFDHDNATVTLLHSTLGSGGEQGGFNRLWIDYAVNDQVQVSAGYIDYLSGTNVMWDAISDNDRLFFNAKYSF